jgi:hypothetical protein
MALDDAGDDVGQVSLRLDADELAGLDQGGDHRPVLAYAVRTSKQGILAIEGQRPDRALDGVGVNLYTPIIEEQTQPDVITRIVAGHPQSNIDDLLAWAYAP